MFPGWIQILLVLVLVILLFGRGKISELMGDVAKGIRSFRDGLTDEGGEEEDDIKEIEGETVSKSVADEADKTRDAS